MDTSATPTLTFDQVVTGTLTSTGPGVWSNGDKTYNATYSVADNNVEHSNVKIDGADAKDFNGNPQDDYIALSEFSVDTKNPTVSTVRSEERRVGKELRTRGAVGT